MASRLNSAFKKRIRPVSEVFTSLRNLNKNISKSSENLVGLFSPLNRKADRKSADDSDIENMNLDEIIQEIERVEKEENALREMHSLYM